MDPESLRNYIKDARQGGLADGAIKQSLLAQGLSLSSVEKLLAQEGKPPSAPSPTSGPAPAPAPQPAAADVSTQQSAHKATPEDAAPVEVEESHPDDEALPFMDGKKKKKSATKKRAELAFVVFLVVAVLGSGGYGIYRMFFSDASPAAPRQQELSGDTAQNMSPTEIGTTTEEVAMEDAEAPENQSSESAGLLTREGRNVQRIEDIESLELLFRSIALVAEGDILYPATENQLVHVAAICTEVINPSLPEDVSELLECPTDPSGNGAFYGYRSDGMSYFELTAALEDKACAWAEAFGIPGEPLPGELCLYTVRVQ